MGESVENRASFGSYKSLVFRLLLRGCVMNDRAQVIYLLRFTQNITSSFHIRVSNIVLHQENTSKIFFAIFVVWDEPPWQ